MKRTILLLLLSLSLAGCLGPTEPLTIISSAWYTPGLYAAMLETIIEGGREPITVTWDTGDGHTVKAVGRPNIYRPDSTVFEVVYEYPERGEYTATCTATDARGQTLTEKITFLVWMEE